MKFGLFFNCFCVGACALSILLNSILLLIAYKKRLESRIGFYRFFMQATVLIGVLYSLTFAVAQPFWYAGPGMILFFSVAPWSSDELLVQIAFQFWFTSFLLILIAMTCSFLYRYGLLCSSRVVSWFEKPRKLAVTLCILISVCAFWLYNTNFIMFAKSQKVRMMMLNKYSSEYEVHLTTSFSVNFNDDASANHCISAAFMNTAIISIHFLIMVRCGWNIHKTIKVKTMSKRLKQIHLKTLRMMIAQMLNPVLFLYVPALINLFGMLVNSELGDLPKIIAMTFALFPIFNPVVVIYFTEEYRRFLFRRSSIVYTSSRRSVL